MDRVFVVECTTAYNKNLSPDRLKTMPIPDLEKLADEVLTPREAVEKMNNGEIDTEAYYAVYREIGDEEIHVKLGAEDWQEIIVNKDLQIHLKSTKDEGYTVDLYAYNENTPDDERDYDNDFISSAYASYVDLEEARNPEE